MTVRKIVVKQEPEKEVPVEVLATAITEIAQGIRKLRNGRMNDRALFLLVQHSSPGPKMSLAEIKSVFDGIDALERTYIQKRR
jgi:hypothetical protein